MEKLLKIMQELREKCPWDQAQTPESLTAYAIEEAYEVEEAVRQGNAQHVKEELGDLLLQVVFQAQMYSERGLFNFNDVVDAISEKLIRRHPHVFQAEQFENLSVDEVTALWKSIKQSEKKDQKPSRLDAVKHAPALIQAQQIQQSAAQIGFDFECVEDAYSKLNEELAELEEAVLNHNSDEICDEFGDCLFSLINVGRKLGVSSEMALLGTIHKFKSRFAYIEDQAQEKQKKIEEMTLEEMDLLWEQAKHHLNAQQLTADKQNKNMDFYENNRNQDSAALSKSSEL